MSAAATKRKREHHSAAQASIRLRKFVGDNDTGGLADAFAFLAEDDDHAETPHAAYDDISEILEWYASKLSKPKGRLRIYDPYFCRGSVVSHLQNLGFRDVYNKNECFYRTIENNKVPNYDVLVTNPPYSDDHIERILSFCGASGKPFFLLLPNFVYINKYYTSSLGSHSRPFYLVPQIRYEYTVPAGVRRKAVTKTAPFLSFWYIDLGNDLNSDYIRRWRSSSDNGLSTVLLAATTEKLPHRIRARYDPTRRRLWKKQREAQARRRRHAKFKAIADARARRLCRFGDACYREDCQFMHPRDAEK